jgi:hypothetical protein
MSTKPDFSGLWRLDVARSRLLGPGTARMLMKIEHREPNFAQSIKADFEDGRSQLSTFRGTTGGTEFVNALPGRTWHSRAVWQGDALIIDSDVAFGERKFHFRDHWFRSGTALVMEHRNDDLAGQIAWLEPAPDAADEFA